MLRVIAAIWLLLGTLGVIAEYMTGAASPIATAAALVGLVALGMFYIPSIK